MKINLVPTSKLLLAALLAILFYPVECVFPNFRVYKWFGFEEEK